MTIMETTPVAEQAPATQPLEVDRVSEALSIIDQFLPTVVTRELVSADEVLDFSLDLRNALQAPRD